MLTARLRVSEVCEYADVCDCDGPACLIETSTGAIELAMTELVDIDFDASSSAITLAIQ